MLKLAMLIHDENRNHHGYSNDNPISANISSDSLEYNLEPAPGAFQLNGM